MNFVKIIENKALVSSNSIKFSVNAVNNDNQETDNFALYTKNNIQSKCKDNICEGSCSVSFFDFGDIIENLNNIEKEVEQWPNPYFKNNKSKLC